MTKEEAEKIYDKIQAYCRAGYLVMVKDRYGDCIQGITPFKDLAGDFRYCARWAQTETRINTTIGRQDGWPKQDVLKYIARDDWYIYKTTFILDLIEGYKKGDRVKVRPGYRPQGLIGTVTDINEGVILVDFGCINSSDSPIITFYPSELAPYFPEEPPETIKIGDTVYNKKEFEEATKDLKPIK